MSPIRVLIADDHAIVRAGIRLLLESQPDIDVVGEARDGREAVDAVKQLSPDVVLMDLAMPGMGGLEATRHIREHATKRTGNRERGTADATEGSPAVGEQGTGTQVLALTMLENERYFFEILQAGAAGYVVKGASPAELIAAIRAVYQGQAYLYPTLAKRLLDDYLRRVEAGEEKDSYDGLTEREREVLKLIAEGHTGREIAELLVLSANTVERHRANMMGKLNLRSRAELIKYAIRKGLIDSER